MKFPRIITRRRAKWAGLAATVCIAATMVASYWYWPSYYWARANSLIVWSVHLWPGGVKVHREWDQRITSSPPMYERGLDSRQAMTNDPMYQWTSLPLVYPHFMWLPKYESKGFSQHPLQYLSIPLWMPLVLCALPTGILFYRDRKPKPGCCTKCRYDLTGLSGDTCPECGTKIAKTDSHKAPARAAEGENGAGLEGNGVGLGENGVS